MYFQIVKLAFIHIFYGNLCLQEDWLLLTFCNFEFGPLDISFQLQIDAFSALHKVSQYHFTVYDNLYSVEYKLQRLRIKSATDQMKSYEYIVQLLMLIHCWKKSPKPHDSELLNEHLPLATLFISLRSLY